MSGILSMILAGGEGTRLAPLSGIRAKPAVPFGGNYRIIDFVLNNFVNSDLLQIFVLTQFKSHSLLKHLSRAWQVSGLTGRFIDPIPAQMQTGRHWYKGTADAIYQNIHLLRGLDPEIVCVFGGDHIYKMDVRQMLRYHREKNCKLTVAAIPVPVEQANEFGVIEVDGDGRMVGFEEKPASDPKTIPGRPDMVLASMGNYIFESDFLVECLEEDARNFASSHDFGQDILPKVFPKGDVYVYDFSTNMIRGEDENTRGYWRDVGTLDSYYRANMDLIEVTPPIDLYNRYWPLRSYLPPLPAAKFVHDEEHRTGQAVSSMVSLGCVISGAVVYRSVLGANVRVASHTRITESVLMGNNRISENCRINRAIIDKNVEIAPGVVIGEDPVEDAKRFHMSPEGVVVIPKNARIGF